MKDKTEVATIDSQWMTKMQAALGAISETTIIFDLAWHLENKRTVGVVVPPAMVDYKLFIPELMDTTINKLVVVPTLDNWVTIRDSFNHERKYGDSLRIFNEDGNVIDCYPLGSRAHLKLARHLKIDPKAREIVTTSQITYMVHGVEREVPRGFCFKMQAEVNNFVIRDMLARYLGRVQMFNEVSHSILHDRAILAQFDKTLPREQMDLVVIYESRKFFDKVRKAKFYSWLATQAKPTTMVLLLN